MASDDRAPGDPGENKLIFMCPIPGCARVAYAEAIAECPIHHVPMVLAHGKKPRRRRRQP